MADTTTMNQNVELENLRKENQELNDKLNNQGQAVTGLLAQLDAHKQMINETLAVNLQLRTNFIMFQKAHQELTNSNEALNKTVSELKNQIEALSAAPKDTAKKTVAA